MSENMLNVENLVIHYETDEEVVEAVNNISFRLKKGEVLGLVGETGAGKTTTALGIMGLLPPKVGHVIQGKIELDGENLFDKSEREMRNIRGKKISMIFQDPMTALNPVKTVGEQIAEVVLLHSRCSKVEALKRAQDMLAMVGIVPERYKDYPHQFSGGMKQRIVIAIALACEPELLIADEPTTALDVTIQAQILDMMRSLQKKQGTSMILITHDLGVVAEMCDHCAVMYAGELVEYGTVEEIFDNPKHPYTKALYQSIPSLDKDVDRLHVVPGMVTDPSNLPEYCSFADRCEAKCDLCEKADPKMIRLNEEHCVKCLQYTKEWEGKINE
ncbi:ABC transporter ATP-binding protein [Mediterraneibacter glycyrrhizinilyticus]|uniref:ABC transporter ATP-binding protein n=1 Tax=Mediterraneibacter glycyrrhizinilyticus TaxID=342942 RepID=UPI00189FCE4B|nr:ABC transporter ATP-binding protein [Mediterraneibacter glycyrrhizinilyticus]